MQKFRGTKQFHGTISFQGEIVPKMISLPPDHCFKLNCQLYVGQLIALYAFT